jgi:hypothetical protein
VETSEHHSGSQLSPAAYGLHLPECPLMLSYLERGALFSLWTKVIQIIVSVVCGGSVCVYEVIMHYGLECLALQDHFVNRALELL